ncbi:hypothetical protein DT380_13705 [Pseudomonas aeruginosa]|nr:hypothetical protein DT380_13705 [Pseudomonas aeruginosa]RCI49441.1 hypothetical protein DT384_19710 [Pseudomonas aeruginosa]
MFVALVHHFHALFEAANRVAFGLAQALDFGQGGVSLLLHSIEHFCPTGDAGCMLRDSHQFIVCIERTALTEDDRIRMHDASHHLRPIRLCRLRLECFSGRFVERFRMRG